MSRIFFEYIITFRIFDMRNSFLMYLNMPKIKFVMIFSRCRLVNITVSTICNLHRQRQQNSLFLDFVTVLRHVSAVQGYHHQVRIHNCKGNEGLRRKPPFFTLKWKLFHGFNVKRKASALTHLFLYSCVFSSDNSRLVRPKHVVRLIKSRNRECCCVCLYRLDIVVYVHAQRGG
jgi:hypothetical protein